jgi:hypothetical protein
MNGQSSIWRHFSRYYEAVDVAVGSKLPLSEGSQRRPETGVKQSKSAKWSAFRPKLTVVEAWLGGGKIAEAVEKVRTINFCATVILIIYALYNIISR